jgi:replicative DNA helicase
MAKQVRRASQAALDSVAATAALGGKMPPQAVEVEDAVLGAIMLDQDAFQDVVEILKPEHFYKEVNRIIFNAMMELNKRMSPIDMLTLTNELSNEGNLEIVGGRSYLVKLTSNMISAVNVEHHARIVFQKYIQRSLIGLGTRMQETGYDDSKDIQDMLDEAESGLFELSSGSLKREVSQVSPVIEEAIAQMNEASKRTDGLSGISSGFPSIDKVTSGWQKSTMVVIAARPAMGKTAFVLSMARKMAVENNLSVAIFSLEMSNVELVKRMMVAQTEIPSDKIKNGRLGPEDWQQFYLRIDQLKNAKIFVDDTPGLSIYDLRAKCRILKKKHQIDIIIIDYLQLMTAGGALRAGGNRQEEVSTISRNLKGLAKELEIPVVALSQLNRSVESRPSQGNGNIGDSHRPQLSDLRESGAIEQDADMVCFLHRPEYYKIYEDENGNDLRGITNFIIAKHRSGALEDINLRFQPELIRFEEASADLARQYQSGPSNTQTIQSRMNDSSGDLGGPVPTISFENDAPY